MELALKKTILHTVLLTLTLPIASYALGLGEMKVQSSLDQPFKAEIELIDVNGHSLATIKVAIADPENFERLGMERTAILSLLEFKIEKNEQGLFVVKIQSKERMTEPYMQMVVDLTWPTGQLYKSYTVLLDPPGYRLVSSTSVGGVTYYKKASHSKNYRPVKEIGVIEKSVLSEVSHDKKASQKQTHKKSTYGPTISNENVWQIAQRYKTSDVILPQVVLAIVGANPDAFQERNLNGLKVGVRLNIPATSEMQKIPADLATEEVMAHDKAWNEKTPINHVITPPYMPTEKQPQIQTPVVATVPPIPKIASQIAPFSQGQTHLIHPQITVPVDTQKAANQMKLPHSTEQEAVTKAEISIAAAAVDSIRVSNALLVEQLRELQNQNKKLQEQLDKRDKEVESIRHQLQLLMKERQSVAPQVSASSETERMHLFWPFLLLLIVATGGGGYAYWAFKRREKERNKPSFSESSSPVMNESSDEAKKIKTEKEVESSSVTISSIEPGSEAENQRTHQTFTKEKETVFSSESERAMMTTIPSETSVSIENSAGELEKTLSDETHISAPSTEETADSGVISHERLSHFKTDDEEFMSEKEPLEFEPGLSEQCAKDQEERPTEMIDDKGQSSMDFEPVNLEEKKADLLSSENTIDYEVTPPSESERDEKNLKKGAGFDPSCTDFFLEPTESQVEENKTEEEGAIEPHRVVDVDKVTNPLKSRKALDTLLALAKTYLSMDDIQSAKQSLDEVMAHGSESQKAQAQALLDQLSKK